MKKNVHLCIILFLLFISVDCFSQIKLLNTSKFTSQLANKNTHKITSEPKQVPSLQAYIKASNPDGGEILGCTFGGILCTLSDNSDRFGYSVALSGDTMVIGAIGEQSKARGIDSNQLDNSLINAGAVYVFVQNNGIWHQQAYLKASNTDEMDMFGYAVAIDGDTLVVGALGEDALNAQNDNNAIDSGAAYVFTRLDGIWSQQAYLKAQQPQADAAFGSAVAIQSDTIIVGAPMAYFEGNKTGIAYVFNKNNDSWIQSQTLNAVNADDSDAFGHSVAISGNHLVIGAPFESSSSRTININTDDNSSMSSGAAYVFNKTNDMWRFDSYLKASNSDSNDHFGQSVSISNKAIVIGAPLEDSNPITIDVNIDDNSVENSGAAYVFELNNNIWSEQSILKSNTQRDIFNNEGFGESVAISGSHIVIGASDTNGENILPPLAHNNGGFGSAYLFNKINNIWAYLDQLVPSRQIQRNNFGSVVVINSDNIVVGANGDVFDSVGVNATATDFAYDSGAAYVYSIKDFKLNAGLTGLWYNPARKGTGIGLYLLNNNTMVATWYTYDSEGNPIWLIGVGKHDGHQASLDVSATSGAMFPPNYNDGDVQISNWGQFKIQFSSCNVGQFSWIPNENNGLNQGHMPINRLTTSQNLACNETNQINESNAKDTFSMKPADTALWYTLEEGGNLINVYMLDNNVVVAMWYVYDNDGKPLWLIGVGSHDGFKAKLNVVNANGGSDFSSFFAANNLNINKWGEFEIEFLDCNQGLFKWIPVEGNGYSIGEKVINRLTNTLGLNCSEEISSRHNR